MPVWLAACMTGAALLFYEAPLAFAQFHRPERLAPVVAFILHPAAGPVAAVIVLGVLWRMDRIGSSGLADPGPEPEGRRPVPGKPPRRSS